MKPNKIMQMIGQSQVEWKPLGKVVLPTANIRWKDTNRTYRYIDLSSVNLDNRVIQETTEICSENAPSRAQKLVLKDDVIFATTRPTQLRVAIITEQFDGNVASTGYCVLRANTEYVLPKWIYHLLTTELFKNYLEENQSGSAYPAISDSKLKEFEIPIPPLPVQKEIVKILDKLTELEATLEATLEAELIMRRKQYQYYRDLLLTFETSELASLATASDSRGQQ